MSLPVTGGIAAAGLLVGLPIAGAIYTRIQTRRAEALVPPLGRFRDVDNVRFHYTDVGQGPAIVMIHGLGAQLRNFTYGVVDRLSDRYRVICIDRPGAGYSVVRGDPHPDLAGQARLVARLIRSLGVDRPLIVGHSLGGALSLRMAIDHPEVVGSLALLSPLTHRQDDIPKAFRALVIPSARARRFVSRTLAVPVGMLNKHKAQAAVFAPEPCPDDFETRGGNALLLRPGSFYAASSEVSGGSGELDEMVRAYPRLRRRVAILFARQDAILDPAKHGEAMRNLLPDGEVELIEGGHMFPITRPAETAAWIDAQARRLAGAGAAGAAQPELAAR